MNSTLKLYNKMTSFPMGKFVFSKVLAFQAPYFSSINPLITELRLGFCRVEMKDRRAVRNHIGSVNAGAMCTLCELTGGLAVESSISPELRWIPKGMTVEYIKKAKGKLAGICSFDPNILKDGDIKIPLKIQDALGDTVLKANIIFYISERK